MRKAPPKGKPKAPNRRKPAPDKAKKAAVFKDVRRQVYADQRAVAGLVQRHIRQDHRICKCKFVKCAAQVELHLNSYGEGEDAVQRASYKGLVICGNVWGCPVCGARVSRIRRGEMNTLLAWARAEGLVPIMLTLTARHGRDDRLADLLDRMKNAKRRLRQRAEWRGLPFAGSVTATEITHGLIHGWHPHFHEIILLRAESEDEALAMVQPLAAAWRVSLRAFGLDGAAAAFDAQGAAAAGDYVTKWGVAEEMTLRDSKGGRAGKSGAKGRIPLELARLAAAGENHATHLWLEYFEATSGARRNQLVWSRGLKADCGVAEVADEEAAARESDDGQESVPVHVWDRGWSAVARKRVRMMEAAETGGGAEAVIAAMAGPDDGQAEATPELVETDPNADFLDKGGDEMVALLDWLDAPPAVQAADIAREMTDFHRRAARYWEKRQAAA